MPVQCFSHFGITVTDPERSMRFYCDMLGFKRVSKLMVSDENSIKLTGLEHLDLHSYFVEREGVRIELMHYISPGYEKGSVARPMNRLGLAHIALRVEGLAQMLKDLEAAGYDIMQDSLVEDAQLGVGVVYVLDPDGVRVELIELPGDPTEALGEPL